MSPWTSRFAWVACVVGFSVTGDRSLGFDKRIHWPHIDPPEVVGMRLGCAFFDCTCGDAPNLRTIPPSVMTLPTSEAARSHQKIENRLAGEFHVVRSSAVTKCCTEIKGLPSWVTAGRCAFCTLSRACNAAMQSIVFSLFLIPVSATKCAGQILAERPPEVVEDDRLMEERIKVPPSYPLAKERALVREILDPELLLKLEPGQSRILRTNYPVTQTAVSNPDIIEVSPFHVQELDLIGKNPGTTTLTIWFEVPNGSVHIIRYKVEVNSERLHQSKREEKVRELQNKVNEFFPNSQVVLVLVDDKVLVRGQARDAKEASEIMQALANGQGSGFGFGNGVIAGYGGQGFNNGSLGGSSTSAGALGMAAPGTLAGIDAAGQDPQSTSNASGLSGLRFVMMLEVPGEQQVMLKVRIAELSRTSSRNKGFNLNAIFDTAQITSTISAGGNLTAILGEGDVNFFLRCLASHGYGKILAEPTLVTISGKPASFLAGGEFAVPTTVGVGGVGGIATTFHGYGTELSFTPTVTDKDLVRLEVAPSFSSINSNATVGGIPGLNRRSVQTTVDLREGQWLAIAGLIEDEQGGQRIRVPFLGNLPIFGGMFGSQDTTRSETELIVLVSPQLVHPMEEIQVPLMLPGMRVTDPTDDDFFLRHMIEGYEGFDHRSTVWPEIESQTGGLRGVVHRQARPSVIRRIVEQENYMCGDCGFSK